MKTLRWYRENEPIPDNAKWLGKSKTVLDTVEGKRDGWERVNYVTGESHEEYLYEIPIASYDEHSGVKLDMDEDFLKAITS